MTPTERYLSMDPRERDALVLQRLFGWKWMRDKHKGLCAFHPPVPTEWGIIGQWEPTMWGPDVYEPVEGTPPIEQRYSDWATSGSSKTIGRGNWQSGMPRPGTDPVAALEVEAEMYWRGWLMNFQRRLIDCWNVSTYLPGIASDFPDAPEMSPLIRVSAPTLPIGIVVAALVATEPEVAHA